MLRLIVIKQRTGWDKRRRCGRCQTSRHMPRFCLCVDRVVREELTMPKLGHRLGPGTAAESTRVVIGDVRRETRIAAQVGRIDSPFVHIP